jgi:predicted nucleic acid-binding protein
MPVLVDSNVILDVATDNPEWSEWSSQALARAADASVLIINPIVFAEVSVGYERVEDLEIVLPPDLYRRDALPYEAAFLAGKTFLAYRRRGRNRPAPLPDFYIGAHALVAGYELLTRDARTYRRYFPRLTVIAPGEEQQGFFVISGRRARRRRS